MRMLAFLLMLIVATVAAQAAEPGSPSAKDEKARAQIAADKAALQPIRQFVGGWRGVGLVDRTRNDEGWGESAQWAWSFEEGRAALVFDSADGKFYKSGKILPGAKAGSFTFIGTLPDGKTTEAFTGILAEGQLTFDADKPAGANRPAQITLRTVAKGDRLLVLYSKQSGATGYAKLAEVGFTRKGSGFGQTAKENECVVTGGEGDIKVEHQGKTYYVCCKGCLDEFKENPEKVLAEFKQRKEEEARKKKAEDR